MELGFGLPPAGLNSTKAGTGPGGPVTFVSAKVTKTIAPLSTWSSIFSINPQW